MHRKSLDSPSWSLIALIISVLPRLLISNCQSLNLRTLVGRGLHSSACTSTTLVLGRIRKASLEQLQTQLNTREGIRNWNPKGKWKADSIPQCHNRPPPMLTKSGIPLKPDCSNQSKTNDLAIKFASGMPPKMQYSVYLQWSSEEFSPFLQA